jgi:hypothetical protein
MDPETLTTMMSNKDFGFFWQQGSGNPAFSANQDTTNT